MHSYRLKVLNMNHITDDSGVYQLLQAKYNCLILSPKQERNSLKSYENNNRTFNNNEA